MKFFKVIMEGGHMGAGKSCETVRYFEASSSVDIFNLLKFYPGIKCKHNARGVSVVQQISKEAYEKGKYQEVLDPYYSRRHFRSRLIQDCSLRPISAADGGEIHGAMTRDQSEGGIGIVFEGEPLSKGSRYEIKIIGKEQEKFLVEVAWSQTLHDNYVISGLKVLN